jgi:1,4-dihydroxy-2-naphthoate octaprenyltransferase
MKNLQKQNAKRNSSAYLMIIALVVLVFGAVQVTGPNYEAGMVVMLLGGLCMATGMLTLQD